jgi:hypothetical protein
MPAMTEKVEIFVLSKLINICKDRAYDEWPKSLDICTLKPNYCSWIE